MVTQFCKIHLLCIQHFASKTWTHCYTTKETNTLRHSASENSQTHNLQNVYYASCKSYTQSEASFYIRHILLGMGERLHFKHISL